MASPQPTSSDASINGQWMWNAAGNPFSKTEQPKWRNYSDIENKIIEQAFGAKEKKAELGEYYIDFTNNRQISNIEKTRQRPVQRVVRNVNEERVRKERFLPNPVELNLSDGQYGFISRFIKEAARSLRLTRDELPSKDSRVIPMVVEKAAVGIISEGTQLKKAHEANYIADMLRAKKNSGLEEIWKCCANLYTCDSFLYKQIDETMRLVGNPQYEREWQGKVETLGPFCLLLWDNPLNSEMLKPRTILYRGAQVSDGLIKSFQSECSKDPKKWHTLQGFTSCTQKRDIAEQLGNVLFIMKTRTAFTIDLTQVSEYKHEEEELLLPGVSFTINRMEFDKSKNKHLVYLTLHQRHNSK